MKDNKEPPYIFAQKVERVRKYNPNYGDNKKCVCGHLYYRHFDSYEANLAIGCKYCSCYDFELKKDEQSNSNI